MINQEPYDAKYIENLLEKEQRAIALALKDGCLDPRKNKDVWKSFSFAACFNLEIHCIFFTAFEFLSATCFCSADAPL